ncbi:MAG TPA: SprT family zinc-dependent metalloprotease [Candidatus Limnocylindrales bacterium]
MDRSLWQDGGVEAEERVARGTAGPIRYLLRRSPRSRTLRVTIDRRLGVVVTIPLAGRRGWARPDRTVDRFLLDREAWIRRHLDRQAGERALVEARGPLGHGALVRYRGELHRVRVEAASIAARSRVSREPAETDGADELVVRLGRTDRRSLAEVLTVALRIRARDAIHREIDRHAAALRVRPGAVTIRDTRSRWGSASRQGRLSFSWRLVLAPPEVLETVVIHELAHLRVFGHGPRFWALVASRRPDHLVWRRWLRDHSYELHAAFEPPPADRVPQEPSA